MKFYLAPMEGITGHIYRNALEKYFPGKVFKTKIPRNVRLSEAPSHGKPVMYYDKSSKGAEAYELLGHEILGEPLVIQQKRRLFGR